MSADLLKTLDLAASNSGTYLGEATWSQASGAGCCNRSIRPPMR